VTTLQDILDRVGDVTEKDGTYVGVCPCHDDRRPSLALTLQAGGKLLVYCRAGCHTTEVVRALGLRMSDLFGVEAGDGVVVASSGPAAPPTADMIAELEDYVTEANGLYRGSPAAAYALERFGLTEDMGYWFRLGYDDGSLDMTWVTPEFHAVPRLVVPFVGFDSVVRAVQGRALVEHRTRWCGLRNPPGHSWATLGTFLLDGDDHNICVAEGPGDALTSLAAGTSSVLIRGAALSRNSSTLDTLIAGTEGRRVVLAGDADPSGVDFNISLGAALADAGAQVHTLQLGAGGDLTEWRESATQTFRDEFQRALRSAPRIDANALPPAITGQDGDELEADLPEQFRRTDEGNARRLVAITGGMARWCPALGWLIYDRGAWQIDDTRMIERAMAAMCENMLAQATDMIAAGELVDDDELVAYGQSLMSWALRSENTPRFEAAIKRAQPMVAVGFDLLDANDHLLPVANGTIDLRTSELRPHDPADFMTFRVDVEYHPDAECPKFKAFLLQAMNGASEMVEFLRRTIGYGLTGSTAEQSFAVFHGGGANGKSVLTSTLSKVFEAITAVASFATFELKPAGSSTADLAALRNKRLVLSQEGEAGRAMAESVLKRCTGGDKLTARMLYRDAMSFWPKFLLILSTNHRPTVRGQDPGFWRRVLYCPFDRFVPPDERDPQLVEKLLIEAEGILAFFVEGARQWYEAGGLNPPAQVREGTAHYQQTSDELGGFVGWVVVADPSARILGREVYEEYRSWAIAEGVPPWSARALNEGLCERLAGVVKRKRREGVWLDGLRLATDDDRIGDERGGDDPPSETSPKGSDSDSHEKVSERGSTSPQPSPTEGTE